MIPLRRGTEEAETHPSCQLDKQISFGEAWLSNLLLAQVSQLVEVVFANRYFLLYTFHPVQ